MKKIVIMVCIILLIVVAIIYFITSNHNSNHTETQIEQNFNNIENQITVEDNLQMNHTAENMESNASENQAQQIENNIHMENINEGEEKMPTLNIKIGDKNFTATLYDNSTTRELIKKMPLSINMSELHGNEKYYYFNQNLPTNSERISRIESGDLMLYGTDCFVLFYKNFSTSYSYTRLGKIDNPSGLESAVGNGTIEITFSLNNE